MEFKECFECHPKPGMPQLCEQCLWVRENYKPKVEALFIDKKGFEKRENIKSITPFFKFPIKNPINICPNETCDCPLYTTADFYFTKMDGNVAIYYER